MVSKWLKLVYQLVLHWLKRRRKHRFKRKSIGNAPMFYRAAAVNKSAIHRAAKNARKPDWVRNEVLRLAALMQNHCSCRKVMVCFNRMHGKRYGVTVGKSFVAELVKTHRLQILQLRREFKTKPPRVVAVNHTWAMDLTFHTDAENRTHANLGMVDHGSRVLLCLRTLTTRNSWTLLGHLCLAIGKYGKPRKLRTDNEIIFNSFVFKTFLKLVGIQKQTTDVHSPWQNGRIERLFGTLEPVLRELHISGKEQLQNVFDEFKLFYNHARPHQNLNNRTPAQVWRAQSNSPRKRKVEQSNAEPVLVQALDGLMTGFYEPSD